VAKKIITLANDQVRSGKIGSTHCVNSARTLGERRAAQLLPF